MKKLIALMLVVSGCTQKEAGIAVTVKIADGVTSSHVQVSASGDGQTQKTKCIAIRGKPFLDVGVVQGSLPGTVAFGAQGFSDEACSTATVPSESADSVNALFVKGIIRPVQLVLKNPAITTLTETDCIDGADNDADGKVDCADTDCDQRACSTGNACVANQTCSNNSCQGGTVPACDAPPKCRRAPGACVGETGCQYPISVGAVCTGVDRCSVGACDVNGDCLASPIVCNAPPQGQCFKASGRCDGDGGCLYEGDLDAGCNDTDNCTVDDRCDLGAICTGRRVACPPRECGVFTNACSGDGQCLYTSTDAGSPCTAGGTCSTAGACVPVFAQPPSNLDPIDFPAPSSSAVDYACGVTIINSDGLAAPLITNGCGQSLPGWSNIKVSTIDTLVLSYASLRISGGSTLKLTGARPVIILSMESVDVLGAIQAEAGAQTCVNNGAGPHGSNAAFVNSGGGGGGFVTAGGRGGGVNVTVNDGVAGGSVSIFGQLRGGCPGGVGSGSNASAAPGGGAVQISARVNINISGTINAPGFGGPGGGFLGGNGGGSGGMIVLEAERIIASGGSLTCNGGGGGQGGSSRAGAAGTQTTSGAAGGNGGTGNASGGLGGAMNADGGNGEDGNFVGGGGGGGVGKIHINAAFSCNIGPSTTVAISPPATSNLPADAGCSR